MTLRTTEDGITLIKAFEGCKLRAYLCPAGKWTVGYGHTTAAGGLVVGPTTRLANEAEALALLHEDIDRFEDQIERLTDADTLQPHQFDALVSFAFNVGMGNFKSSTLLKKLKAGDTAAVAAQFGRWNKIEDPHTHEMVANDGLTRRRRAERALFEGDLADAQTYMGMTFPPMPQDVAPPPPPKPMAQSKVGNTSIIGGAGAAILGAKSVLDTAQTAAQPVVQVTQQAQTVAGQVQTTVQQAQGTMDVVHGLIPHISLGAAAPWCLLTVLVVTGFAYTWYDRRKKLHEEGV